MIYDGDYSMEVRYQLLTNTPWGSWVSAARVPTQPLDWTGVDTVKIWVKGDGSDNYFRFRFKQADGQMWEMTDKKALSATRWTLVAMPIGPSSIGGSTASGARPNLAGIKSYELMVVSPGASSNSGGKTSVGRIWVDLLFVTGEQFGGARIIPAGAPAPTGAAPTAAPAAAPAARPANLDFSLIAYTNFSAGRTESSQQQRQIDHVRKTRQLQRHRRVGIGIS